MGKAWAKSVMAVLDLARICAEAATKLADEDFTRLEKSLPFGPAKMSMLRRIGADTRLFEKDVMERLPPSYSIIYQVHLLNDEELKHAIESHLLRPSVRREQIEKLRLKRGYSKLKCLTIAEMEQAQDRVHTCETSANASDCEPEHSVTCSSEPSDLVVFGELLLPRNFKRLSELHDSLELLLPRNFKRLSELHDSLLDLVRSYGIEFVPRPAREARVIHEFEEKSASYVRYIERRRARDAG
jgi:hypothetical protein